MASTLKMYRDGYHSKNVLPDQGCGGTRKDLRAFEEALRDAGINTCNLIKTSSIIAAGCKRVTREEGMKYIQPGQITFAVIAPS